jgi:hypothetical protein
MTKLTAAEKQKLKKAAYAEYARIVGPAEEKREKKIELAKINSSAESEKLRNTIYIAIAEYNKISAAALYAYLKRLKEIDEM